MKRRKQEKKSKILRDVYSLRVHTKKITAENWKILKIAIDNVRHHEHEHYDRVNRNWQMKSVRSI